MTDREKVINGLEHCLEGVVGCQKRCPYKRDFACRSELARDALVLLKEQEPVEPHIERDLDIESWFYGCGNCHFAIDYKDKFCRHCGREVKWDT